MVYSEFTPESRQKVRVLINFPWHGKSMLYFMFVHAPYGFVHNYLTQVNDPIFTVRNELRKGNVFTSVCQEFCPQCGGMSRRPPPRTRGRHPLGRHPRTRGRSPQTRGRHPPWADTPPTRSRHPPDQRQTPSPHPPAHGYCSGRYASYWNAFLSFDVAAMWQSRTDLQFVGSATRDQGSNPGTVRAQLVTTVRKQWMVSADVSLVVIAIFRKLLI